MESKAYLTKDTQMFKYANNLVMKIKLNGEKCKLYLKTILRMKWNYIGCDGHPGYIFVLFLKIKLRRKSN